MSSPAVFRHIIAVVTLAVSVGCAGGDPLQDLKPEPAPRTRTISAMAPASRRTMQMPPNSTGFPVAACLP